MKHTHDATDKSDLRTALDAMKVQEPAGVHIEQHDENMRWFCLSQKIICL